MDTRQRHVELLGLELHYLELHCLELHGWEMRLSAGNFQRQRRYR